MTFQELLAEIQKLKLVERRSQTAQYLEVVVSKVELPALLAVLTAYFGVPLKPEGQSPSGEANRRAKPYGGIRKDQTMYFRKDGNLSECVLLWPWGNGVRITAKVIQTMGGGSGSGLKGFFAKIFGQ